MKNKSISSISILSTRPLTHNVMMQAEEQDVQIDVASFIETKNIINKTTGNKILQLASKEIAVVFTSMNAAEAVIDCLKAINAEPEWTIYTLGGITNTILTNHFIESEVFSDATNATELAETIIENEEEHVTFFCGNQRREELPKMLQEQNIKVDEIVVYETIETPVKIDKDYNGILFFSPSAVKSFFSNNKIHDDTVLFAIGKTTAKALKQYSMNKVLVGTLPNKEHLAQQAIEYLKQTAT
jgi:uroporphyrinogen-III synthase